MYALQIGTRALAAATLAFPLVAWGGGDGAPQAAQAAHGPAKPAVVKILSLVGDRLHPNILYIGGSAASPDFYNAGFYGYWRSTDSGTTWSDLGHALGLGQTFTGHENSTDPTSDPIYGQTTISTFHIAPDDSYLLAAAYHQPNTPGTAYTELIRSADGGLSWTELNGDQGQYGYGQYHPVISPVSSQRAYRINSEGDFSGYSTNLETSSDGGRSWSATGDTSTRVDPLAPLDNIVADTARATTVYAGYRSTFSDYDLQWLRSDDAGTTWSAVITPTDSPALANFTLATDSHLPGLLVARTVTKGIPADPPIAHAPTGQFANFWRAHGGLAVFGAPITPEFDSENGDGTRHTYTMQYFQNARLEAHPENKDLRYRIELGLLGPESLHARGWLQPPS